MAELAIELIGVNKRFGEVHANKNISFGIRKGAIHGIIGENGAGKSTLMSILYGYYQADSGSIRINGQEQRIRSSQDAIAKGIGMVHQHFMLVDPFTVLENIVLGAEEGISLESSLAAARRHLADLNATTACRWIRMPSWASWVWVASSGWKSSRRCTVAPMC